MLEITTHRFPFFTRKEFWFYEGENINEGTYNMFSVAAKLPEKNACYVQKYQTSVIDLHQGEQDLFQRIHPRYRSYIRAAEKNNLEYAPVTQPTKEDCSRLAATFKTFAKHKTILPIRNSWIKALHQSKNICFTKIRMNETDIITHVYLFDKSNIILTHTFHNLDFKDERVRSDANKLLHWKDILLFKKMNYQQYDFGGINPEKLPGISNFKLNFGGEVKEYYRYIQTTSLLFLISNLYKRIKHNNE